MIWHRRSGILAAVFVLILSVTGLLLNHTSELELGKQLVNSKLLLNWYGIELPDNPSHFRAGNKIISQLGEQLYIDSEVLSRNGQTLIGAVATPDYIVIALQHELMLITKDGELLERISDLPEPTEIISAVGLYNESNIALKQGKTITIADADMIDWQKLTNEKINWSEPAQVDKKLSKNIISAYQNHDLSYERVLLDLHSGRLFASWGPLVMDSAAVILIILAISGLWRWLHARSVVRRKKNNSAST